MKLELSNRGSGIKFKELKISRKWLSLGISNLLQLHHTTFVHLPTSPLANNRNQTSNHTWSSRLAPTQSWSHSSLLANPSQSSFAFEPTTTNTTTSNNDVYWNSNLVVALKGMLLSTSLNWKWVFKWGYDSWSI